MYRFSLETVLTHRRHIEDMLRKAFADGKKLLLSEKEVLMKLEATMVETQLALQERQSAGARVSDLVLYDSYIKQISINIGRQVHRISELENQLRQKLNELIDAMKRRKVLEKLKEKELEIYRKEIERKERASMSEIAISGFNMRNRS